MSKKFIPNGDLDFVMKAESFARTLLKDVDRYEIPRGDAEELDVAVKAYRAALNVARSGGGRSAAATRAKEDARAQAEQIMRRLGHLVRLNKKLDGASKIALGIRERTARPKATPCPQEPPKLRFVRALHESGASPMHELKFTAMDWTKAKPEGAVRLELFVDLVAPDEPVPTHPGANLGSRPWYLRSYTRSPIVIAPPMPRVPMRILYWARWADSAGGVGPFSATAAAWIEGGTHHSLPGGFALQLDRSRPQPKMLDTDQPQQPAERDERYRVAVLEVHYQSFHTHAASASLPAPETAQAGLSQSETRQLEGPAAEAEAA